MCDGKWSVRLGEWAKKQEGYAHAGENRTPTELTYVLICFDANVKTFSLRLCGGARYSNGLKRVRVSYPERIYKLKLGRVRIDYACLFACPYSGPSCTSPQ